MVDYTTFVKIGLEQCAPTGAGTQDERRQTLAELAEIWNDEKREIKSMTEAEVRSNLTCP